MFRYFFALLALGALLLYNTAQAQTDSSLIDLGRLSVKKQFTQTVTIKGEDLEKYPFTNLAEALNVWLYGVNSNQTTLNYVVDGVQVTDVNTYPIQDIEEVTLVQNALTHVSSNTAPGQLVLIRLRKNRSKPSGAQISAQSALTNFSTNPKGTNNDFTWFQNHYVAGYKNWKHTSIGVSANYLEDAKRVGQPAGMDDNRIFGRDELKRTRLNGYLSSQLGNANQLDVTVGYTRQTLNRRLAAFSSEGLSYNDIVALMGFAYNNHNFNSALRLTSKIDSGLSNQFKTGYNAFDSQKRLSLSDELRYRKQAGGWLFEPALNLSYQVYWLNSAQAKTFGTITPSLTVTQGEAFNLTGGINLPVNMASKGFENTMGRFISTTLVPFKLLNKQGSNALTLYGSHAWTLQPGTYTDDLNSYSFVIANPPYFSTPSYSDMKTWNIGASFKFLNDKLRIGYNFDKRNYTSAYQWIGSFVTTDRLYVNYKSHRAEIGFDALAHQSLKWYTGINASITNFHTASNFSYIQRVSNYGDKIWTGGWVNRLTAGGFFAGADLLYDFNRPTGNAATSKTNSISLQNAFAGISINKHGAKWLDVYASSRNPYENSTSIITDKRRFYGLGLQLYF